MGNLIRAIDAARDRPLASLLVALGIRHVGSTMARLLARRFRSLPALLNASEEEIAGVEGVGPTIARSVREWAEDPENRALAEKLARNGVRVADPEPEGEHAGLLEGVTVVITGTLEGMSRERAQLAIEERGGKVTSSVSKKTTALVSGENPGSKLAKAEQFGVPVIDEDALPTAARGGTGGAGRVIPWLSGDSRHPEAPLVLAWVGEPSDRIPPHQDGVLAGRPFQKNRARR